MSYFDETLVIKLQGIRVEGVPSLWYFPSLDLLVAGYVDDIVAAGPVESQQSWPITLRWMPSRNQADTWARPLDI